jgi:lactoylglutathione lyase
MLRVGNLDASIKFYEQALNLKLLRRKDYESGRFTLAFLGYGGEEDHTVIELTHNWDKDGYEVGTGYGHLAFGVDNLQESYDHLIACGGTAKVAPKVFGGGTRLAFVKDLDGYDIELIELSSKFTKEAVTD